MIEGGRDPVEIFEQALAIRLDEIAGIRGGVGARTDDCKRIDPTLLNLDANAVATYLHQSGNMAINNAVELRKRLAQAHPGLRVSRPVP